MRGGAANPLSPPRSAVAAATSDGPLLDQEDDDAAHEVADEPELGGGPGGPPAWPSPAGRTPPFGPFDSEPGPALPSCLAPHKPEATRSPATAGTTRDPV